MTPAEEDALIKECCPFEGFAPKWADIRLAIRAAVARERERCAKVCEEPNLICCGSPAINDHGIYGIETGCCGCPEREEKTALECAAAIRRGE